MSHVVRIPSSIYTRLEKHAQGFDSPINVIEKLLNHYEQSNSIPSSKVSKSTHSTRSRQNTVQDWTECVEVVLGFKEGSTPLDDNAPFIRNIYNKFCKGEAAYGVSGVNAMEAYLRVIKQYNPDKFELALTGLRKSIEQSDKPFHKMKALLKRASNESF